MKISKDLIEYLGWKGAEEHTPFDPESKSQMNPDATTAEYATELERTRALLRQETEERRRLEVRMQKCRMELAELKEIAHVGSYSWDILTDETRWSDACRQILGFRSREFSSRSFRSLILPADLARVMEARRRALKEGLPFDIEYRIKRADGIVRWLHEQAKVERDGKGNAVSIAGTLLDISNRKLTGYALKSSEIKFQKAFHASPDAIAISSVDEGLMLDINEGFQRIFGFRHDETVGRSIVDMGFWKDENARLFMLEKMAKEGRVREMEVGLYDRRGKLHACLFSTEVFELDGKSHLVSVIRDITEQKRTEAALKKSRRDLTVRNRISDAFLTLPDEAMFERVKEIIIKELESPYGLFGYMNDMGALVCPFLTREAGEAPGDSSGNIVFSQSSRPKLLKKLLEEQGRILLNTPVRMPEEHLPIERLVGVPILYKHRPIGALLCANRLNEYTAEDLELLRGIADHIAPVLNARLARKREKKKRMRLKKQLQQAHKIESIGTLAGGIAHDFNNILSPIMIYSEMLFLSLPEHDPHKEHLKKIFKAGGRARDLVQQILTFSRQSEQKPSPLKIVPVVKECIKMLRSVIPSTIEIHQMLDVTSDTVPAHPTHIHQILMNMCTNAAHAMRLTGGVLTIGLGNVPAKEAAPVPGPCLLLSINDTGHGIDPAVMDRIFDPYFTTKARGDGTGLGLSVVHGIVQSCNGAIEVSSRPGRGTTFRIFLPLLEDAPPMEPPPLPDLPGGTEHILIVDDEAFIIDSLEEILTELGYTVTACLSSIDALERFTANPGLFDLVVTDMTMPHMTGSRLAERMLALRPELPVILCTGFSELIDKDKAEKIGIRAYVMKPIIIGEMARTIRELLEQKASQS